MQTITAATNNKFPAALALRGMVVPSRPQAPLASDPLFDGGTRRTVAKGEEIFADGDPADYIYKVMSGTVRSCKLLNDGRRQIDAFHFAGDIFGLESGAEHRLTAEAVDEVVVLAFRRSRFDSLVQGSPALSQQLMASVIASLERAHDHMVLLGRKTAQEKIASFLLAMANRLAPKADRFELPMQRADIADHLGLTIETVSRVLTQMMRDGLIKLAAAGRTIVLQNRMSLQQLNA
jgi:CRP/FNR family nitrogen fixation transcriptional regulator